MITLTIPNDDTIALRQFGKVLIEIASEKDGHPVDVTVTPLVISTETLQQAAPQTMGESEVDTIAQQVESLAPRDGRSIEVTRKMVELCAPVKPDIDPSTTDSTGTPWDERIHSASKALNADGTWRLRRKPKDETDGGWARYIETVKGELLDKENKDFEEWEKTKQPDYLEPPVASPGDDHHTDTDVVTEQTVAGIPPLPVPPPVVVAPPHTSDVGVLLMRAEEDAQPAWDFPRLMTFLTERHGKIDVATVNTLLAQDGMLSVQELNAHPDKIGPFVARVKAHLGE